MEGLEELSLDSFRGGLAARTASTEFREDQWAKLYGFVVEDSGILQSQWPLQAVGGEDSISSLGVYEGHSGAVFLVAVLNDGTVRWCVAPDDDEPSDGALTPTWVDLANADTSTPGLVPERRPIALVPLDGVTSAGFRSSLLLSSIEISDTDSNIFVYEDDAGGVLRFYEVDQLWPPDVDTEACPKAEHGVLWNGVLVLGDIEWNDDKDVALSVSNKKRFRNGLWLSEPGLPLRYDPLNVVFIGDAHAKVTGLVQIDVGLLVFTSSAQSGGGVWLLRGTPEDYVREPLRLGIGAARNQAAWQQTGTAAWVTATGEVWQTDGQRVVRVDWQGLGTGRDTQDGDGCAEFGPWLLTAVEGRLFCLRALDDQSGAAWTELALDGVSGDLDMYSAHHVGNVIYLLSGGKVWRFTRANLSSGQSERGYTPAGWAELTVGTRTLESGGGHLKTFWHRVGVRATAGRGATVGRLKGLTLKAGPTLDLDAPSLDRSGPFSLLDSAAARRFQALVRGIGASNELSVEATFDGDVRVEQFSVFYRGARLGGDSEGR